MRLSLLRFAGDAKLEKTIRKFQAYDH